MTRRLLVTAAFIALVSPALVRAQARGGRGAAQAGPPQTARQQAPIELTGYWVSIIVDEWRFRVTPQKGDIAYLPLNAQARQIAASMGVVDLHEGSTGGGSDGNFTAGIGIPTLDGMGGVGEGAHAVHEHILISELPRRALLLAGMIENA